ncbi:preprotein translocase subunit SecE [bacterium]|nr:preprotein translocase subunit SecE [Actinomycetota bacterium]MBE32935.1 preprotein translocase subunit SecE [bacterium]|tara:strand:+ start:1610 stop:1837 length:228 start_codon:yes stop_codon:yes gene_type:complete
MVTAKKDISHVKKSQKKPSFSTNPSIELKKVTWPNRDTLIKSTVLILALVIILTSYVSGLDLIFSKLFYILRGQV